VVTCESVLSASEIPASWPFDDDSQSSARPVLCGAGAPMSLFPSPEWEMERREAPGVCETPWEFARLLVAVGRLLVISKTWAVFTERVLQAVLQLFARFCSAAGPRRLAHRSRAGSADR